MTGEQLVQAIRDITRETGYPPSPDELAEISGRSLQSLHSALTPFKRSGEVGYDDDGNLVAG